MIEKTRHEIPADHPIRAFFRQLTERGMGQLNLHDPDTIQYITNLLTEFIQIENQYRFKDESGRRMEYLFEMLTECSKKMSPTVRYLARHLNSSWILNGRSPTWRYALPPWSG